MFAFRVDSSRDVGAGHVMRCLSLADYLAAGGSRCVFLCRPATGDLIGEIERRGHTVIRLSLAGANESGDAYATRAALEGLPVSWLIVDHYALGIEWERNVAPAAQNLLVIDDMGRSHDCGLLLDQNYPNPMHAEYKRTLPAGKLLLGPEYALLRPEFALSRGIALRRRNGDLGRILVSMGGSDPGNETFKVLCGLESVWQDAWHVDAVIGAANPHRESVESMCLRLPAATLWVQATNMAHLMTQADCAVGAGGSTTWERCCLGLPAIVSILSVDQIPIATAVAGAGAQALVSGEARTSSADYAREVFALKPEKLRAMSAAAAKICDGMGARRVAELLR